MSERQEIKEKLSAACKKVGPFAKDYLPTLQIWALLEIADELDNIRIYLPELDLIESKLDRLIKVISSK